LFLPHNPTFRLLFCNLSFLWEHAQISNGSQSINVKEKTMANLPNLEEKIQELKKTYVNKTTKVKYKKKNNVHGNLKCTL
jgi:hypothetical protein